MDQIVTLQIFKKDNTPVNEYNWREILRLKEDESVKILDYWILRGTKSPDPKDCENQE